MSARYRGLDDRELKWEEHGYRSGEVYDLRRALRGDGPKLAYLYCRIKAHRKGKLKFFAGSDEAMTVWLAGKKVHEFDGRRDCEPHNDQFELDLDQGDNSLLIKLAQSNGDWKWGFADSPPQNDAPEPIRFALDVVRR